MRYCPNCGNKLPENAKFCGLCGTKFRIEKENSGSVFKFSYLIGLLLLSIILIFGTVIGMKIYKKEKYKNLVSQSQVDFIDCNYVNAENNCKEAIELFPEEHEAYVVLAKVYEETHRKDGALENYEKALSIDAGALDAYKGIINIYIDDNYEGTMILEVVEEAMKHISENELISFSEIQQHVILLCRLECFQRYINDNMQSSVSKNNQYIDGTTGISFAKLLDMDGDTIEELVVAYTKSEYAEGVMPTDIDDYVVEVCTYVNNRLLRAFSGSPLVTSSNTKEVVLLQTEGNWKLVKDEKQITNDAQVYVLQGMMGTGAKLAFNELEETRALLEYKVHGIRSSIQRYLQKDKVDENKIVPLGCYSNMNQGIYLVSEIDDNKKPIIKLYVCKREVPFYHHNRYSFTYNSETQCYEYDGDTNSPIAIDVRWAENAVLVDLNSGFDYRIVATIYIDEQFDFEMM